jgi:catechol 2,3-dioxygenase-like lactoylglutathione lyase family enzyme
VKATDQFHVGVVVDDLEATLAQLTDLFGYEWCDEIGGPMKVVVPGGETEVEVRFVYSRTEPRVEVIRTAPGTLWEPAGASGIHHLGYWSDDVAGDSAALLARGYVAEAAGVRPDGTPYWTFHRSAIGPRVELVDRAVQPGLEQYWAQGR